MLTIGPVCTERLALKMALLQRKIYISGLIVWLLYVFLVSTWIPRSHSQVVGLGRDFARWSIGIIILGMIFRVTSQVYRSKAPDPIISTGWSVTLSLVLAWLSILAIPMFSTVIPAETEILTVTILSVGALGGLVFGIWQNVKNRNRLQARREEIDLSSVCRRFALKGRKQFLFVSRVMSALALMSACVCAVLSGLGLAPLIAGTLLFASIAVFSCIELDRWKPGWGGIVLCGLALIATVVISLFCIHDTFGFEVFVAALSSSCVGFPMFVIGTLLFLSAERRLSRLDYVWWVEFILAEIVTGYFLWHTGASIERIALEWLHWNLGSNI